jgi:hypothetical protein
MHRLFLLAVSVALAGCASLPVRDFRADYERAPSQQVKIDGYPPFVVSELRDRRRLQVQLNVLAQAFSWASNPLVLAGLSDGIPSQSAHAAAARHYLVETGRPSCTVSGAAITPNGRAYEFTYACA